MAAIIIKDLESNRELDKKLLANIKGGNGYTPYSYNPYSYNPYSYNPYSYNPYSYNPYSYNPYPAAASFNIGSLLAPFNSGHRFFQ